MDSAYTVGHTVNYDRNLAEATPNEPVRKVGERQDEDYAGGWVWRTPEDAQSFLDDQERKGWPDDWQASDFSIYELELPTNWDTNVSLQTHDDGVHRLLHDAVIVGKR